MKKIFLMLMLVFAFTLYSSETKSQHLTANDGTIEDTLTLSGSTSTSITFANTFKNQLYVCYNSSSNTGWRINKIDVEPEIAGIVDSLKLTYQGAIDSALVVYGYIAGNWYNLPVEAYTSKSRTIPKENYTVSGSLFVRFIARKEY